VTWQQRRTKEELEQITKKVRLWLASPEGKEALKGILERSHKVQKRLEKARKVDWESLHRPMTI